MKKQIFNLFLAVVLLFTALGCVSIKRLIESEKSTEPKTEKSSEDSSSKSDSTSKQSSSKKTYSQDTGQGEKVGFKIVSSEDATSRHFFPNANKTSAVTYESGSGRLVSFLSVYDSPADAASAFEQILKDRKSEGWVITSQGDTFAYYNQGDRYAVGLYVENKLYEYNARNQQVLKDFAK